MCNISARIKDIYFIEPLQQEVDGGRGAGFPLEEAVTPDVGVLGGLKEVAAVYPTGDHLETAQPQAQWTCRSTPAGKREATITIGEYGGTTLRATEGE